MVKRHTKSEAFQYVAVRAKPFFTERNSGLQRARIDREQGRERAARMQVDYDLSKWFDTPALWAVDQNGLAVADEALGGSKAQLLLTIGEEPSAKPTRWLEQRWRHTNEEPWHEGSFLADAKI